MKVKPSQSYLKRLFCVKRLFIPTTAVIFTGITFICQDITKFNVCASKPSRILFIKKFLSERKLAGRQRPESCNGHWLGSQNLLCRPMHLLTSHRINITDHVLETGMGSGDQLILR